MIKNTIKNNLVFTCTCRENIRTFSLPFGNFSSLGTALELILLSFFVGDQTITPVKVSNGKTHCKIRGFTLNYKNSLILNFDSLEDIICKYVKTPVKELKKTRKNKNDTNSINITNERKITREKWTRQIVNKCEVKE